MHLVKQEAGNPSWTESQRGEEGRLRGGGADQQQQLEFSCKPAHLHGSHPCKMLQNAAKCTAPIQSQTTGERQITDYAHSGIMQPELLEEAYALIASKWR